MVRFDLKLYGSRAGRLGFGRERGGREVWLLSKSAQPQEREGEKWRDKEKGGGHGEEKRKREEGEQWRNVSNAILSHNQAHV